MSWIQTDDPMVRQAYDLAADKRYWARAELDALVAGLDAAALKRLRAAVNERSRMQADSLDCRIRKAMRKAETSRGGSVAPVSSVVNP